MKLAAPLQLSAVQIRAAILAGTHSVLEITDAHLAHIERFNGQLHAFQTVDVEGARARAVELDSQLRAGEPSGALFGVPVALKANLCLAGSETNCGSRILEGYRAPYTACSVQRLLDAGAIPLGVTQMDEFAMGSSGENSAYETPRNPWDPNRCAGGSSGGSAVAVAAHMVPIALGSDTGGSVRQPAAFCGVYGLRPTYGRVSRYGLVAFASSLDTVSPFARTPQDLERVLAVLSGQDKNDSTCLPLPPFEPERPAEVRRLMGFKVGVLKQAGWWQVTSEVQARCAAQLEQLKGLGAELVEIELPHLEHALPAYYVIASAEASSNLARYDGSLFGQRRGKSHGLQGMFASTRNALFGDEVKRRILLGTHVLSAGQAEAWFGKAQRARTLLRRDFDTVFEGVDVIANPTSATTAFPLGTNTSDPLAMYRTDLLTVPAALAGLPALSLPADQGTGDLPVGLQLTGPALSEGRLLRLAGALEMERQGQLPCPGLEGACP